MENEKSKRIAKAKELFNKQKKYPKGCSEFISEVLEIPFTTADEIMGNPGVEVGSKNIYSGLVPGDIAGWKTKETLPAHVTIYLGEENDEFKAKFLDVQDLNMKPRKVKNGYGDTTVYKSSNY